MSIGIRLLMAVEANSTVLGNDETEKLFAHQQYLYYLARLLVLAKLGGSSGHPGLPSYAPKLLDA